MESFLLVLIYLAAAGVVGIVIGYIFGKSFCKYGSSDKKYILKNDSIKCEGVSLENIESKGDNQDKSSNIENNNIDSNIQEDSIKAQKKSSDTKEEKSQQEDNLNKEIENSNSEAKESQQATEIQESQKEEIKENKTPKDALLAATLPSNSTKVEDQKEKIEDKDETKIEEEGIAPKLLDAPIDGKKDNLCKIKGIGVKIEEKLNKLGIYHFEQIASWSEKEIAWVDSHLAFKGRIKREGWVEQAKKLARGEETEFSKRVEAGEVISSKKS